LKNTQKRPKTDDGSAVSRVEQPEPKLPDPATILNQIRKWGLHFDGKDPLAFLERLDELKLAYGFLDDSLLLGLPEPLRGDSLLWYRNNRENWGTWGDFCQAFRTQYLPPGYQRALRQEIEGRRQLTGETFDKYATAMLTMMRRAGGYTKQDQLEQLYENMNPDYQIYIRPNEATSIVELSSRAAQYEKVKKFRKDQRNTKQSFGPVVAAASYSREECCWRYKQRGHTRWDCKRPPKKFCSRCGKDGVFTRDCHPPPENQRQAGGTSAISGPEKLE